MEKVEIRLASDSAGPQIAEVLGENGIVLLHADWTKVSPHWLIATLGEEVIGCLQIVPSRPIGYLEYLFVRPSAPKRAQVVALRKLMHQGLGTLRLAGCNYSGNTVAQTNRRFSKVIEKMGLHKVFAADLYVLRLA